MSLHHESSLDGMAPDRAFMQVDVFTETPLMGNPVAVVLESTGLSTQTMHTFTSWTNLSEATFITAPTSPDADYAVRIFCPGRELPFAGHPTLGTCHAWLSAGGQPKGEVVIQECGAGLIRIRRRGDGALFFAAPPLIRSGPLSDAELEVLIRGLGLRDDQVIGHQWCDNGPGWQTVMVSSVQVLRAITPDSHVLAGLDVGVVAPADDDVDYEVRAFFPGNQGLVEDPVTGSLNAAIAQWLIGEGIAPEIYTAAQGTSLGRSGRVIIERDGSDIWVGGHCVDVISGRIRLN
jgi:PhzF family phenazine biosynthesis protein